jgi:hypothetical protein
MPEDAPRMSPTVKVLIGLGIAVVVVGALLIFFGVGAELSKPKEVTFTVRSDQVRKVISDQVKVGDPVFTDFGGMYIGRVSKVEITQDMRSVPDAQGRLHATADPLRVQTDITVTAPGREGDGIVALSNQVIQAGTQFSVISDKYVIKGSVVQLSVH